jgi:2-polyprenyl-6-hydroxyphenyl methylase/3-demethylubiquinone-9 3-methyltransferase
MKNTKNMPFSAKVFFMLRPLIIPFEIIEKYVPKEGIIVDIGCGYGVFANHMSKKSKNRKVIGIDLNEKRIEAASKIFQNEGNLEFICSDITNSKIPKADVITAIDILHHIPNKENQEKLLKSCYFVLKNEGVLILKDLDIKPLWKFYWNKFHDFVITKGEPVLYNSKEEILELLEKSGFAIEKFEIFKGYPYAHVLFIGKK